jgi:hypothetical protein
MAHATEHHAILEGLAGSARDWYKTYQAFARKVQSKRVPATQAFNGFDQFYRQLIAIDLNQW